MDHINDIPMGFGMALLQNPSAASYYNSLTDEERRAIIEKTHAISSKADMKAFVESLDGKSFIN